MTSQTDLTPPPANSAPFQYHRTHCWCCSARACREWREEKEHSREGRHTTSLLLAWGTLQHVSNKHTLDEGPWSVGLEGGLQTCIRQHLPCTHQFKTQQSQNVSTAHFPLCAYRGIGGIIYHETPEGGGGPGARASP